MNWSLRQAVKNLRAIAVSVGHPKDPAVAAIFGVNNGTATGKNVTPDTALALIAVYACVRVLAETIGTLPLILYKREAAGGSRKKRDSQHSLFDILRYEPNPEMSAVDFWEMMIGHMALRGKGYAHIDFTRGGDVKALWPMHPDTVQLKRSRDGVLYYEQDAGGEKRKIPAWQMFHPHLFGPNGLDGYSPIRQAKEGIGLALSAEEYGGRFFSNDSRPGGILEHPGKLSPEAHKNLLDSIESSHGGVGRSHKTMITEEGMTWKQIGIAPDDAQFLETRKFQVTEIARLFRVPPHMIADLEKATFSNIEHQGIEFVVHTVRPWAVRIEQAIHRTLLAKTEKRTHFAEFLVDGLLRGDISSRYTAYSIGRQWGWLNANEIRELENMNPMPPESGDVYLHPMNMMPAGQADIGQDPSPEAKPDDERKTPVRYEKRSTATQRRLALRGTFQTLLRDAGARVVRREVHDVRAAAQKHFGKRDGVTFRAWLDAYYNDFRSAVSENMGPVFDAYGAEASGAAAVEAGAESAEVGDFVSDYTSRYAEEHVGSSRGQLSAIIEGQDDEAALEAVENRLDEWEEKRAEKIGRRQAVSFGEAVALAAFVVIGIETVRWNANANACPLCNEMDGQVVGVNKQFKSAGDTVEPGGDTAPLSVKGDVFTPPLHDGCECFITTE